MNTRMWTERLECLSPHSTNDFTQITSKKLRTGGSFNQTEICMAQPKDCGLPCIYQSVHSYWEISWRSLALQEQSPRAHFHSSEVSGRA